ncbi:MAG: sugar phosphate isomerase/epimerase [Planctomycetota bacterium]|nr:sugar phosphate isomerase/epimerase [Planctomycetota bacterium]MDI6788062.1 sugar phosphate isomerase/epimerase [Planctomycetota bacterium]
MKFAYSTNAFKRYTLEDALRLIKEIGFDGVEIMADHPHLYPPDCTLKKVERLNHHLTTLGLKVSNLNTFTLTGYPGGNMHHPSWIEKDTRLRQVRYEHTRNCLRLAAQLGCPNISTQPGGKVEDFSPEESIKLFISGLQEMLPLALQLGVKILIEPEPELLLENSGQFAEFIKQVDSSLIGLNCDIGHFYCAGEEPSEVIRTFRQYIYHIHIEDIKNRIHNHLICGQGEIDFASVFAALKEINYIGFISVELYPYQENPVQAGKISLEYLRKIISV